MRFLGQRACALRPSPGESNPRHARRVLVASGGHSAPSGEDQGLEQRKSSTSPHVDQRGPEAWQPEGIKVLGTPIGSAAFIRERMMTRIAAEQRLWDAIPRVPDLQCGWQLLLAGPRANHMIRTLPPELSSEYASEHDEGMWRTAVALFGQRPGTPEQLDRAKMVASLPMHMGGRGRLRPISTSASFFFRVRPISTSVNFDFGRFLDVEFLD